MKAEKKKISDLTLCYCVAPLQYQGKRHFLVASEKEHPCYLFDENGNCVDKVWDEPGGTMTIVQYPGSEDGAFLATHKFYSPNNSKEAKLVLCWKENDAWQVMTIAELPFVHRFDILTRNGQRYLLACCIKSDYEYKDDWRFPGMTLGAKMPSLEELKVGVQPAFENLQAGMLKNHGYCRHVKNGVQTGIVTCDGGVYRFTPPENEGAAWAVEQLIDAPVSDAVLVDFDGDGAEELLTLSPFHGDTLRVYHENSTGYKQVYEYEKKIEFAHAICAGNICGKNRAIIGHRKGDRDLFAVSYDNGYAVEILDHDIGPANVMYMNVNGKDVLVGANREINEVAYYTLED